MSIIRSPRRGVSTVIPHSVGLDHRLSMKALGVLIRLLCRPDGYETNSETLAAEFGCGKDAMRGALRELSDAGYLRLIKTQDKAGLWRSAWHVLDADSPHQASEPEAGFPAPVNPAPVRPAPENPPSVATSNFSQKTPLEGVASRPDAVYPRAHANSSINTLINTNTNTSLTNTFCEIKQNTENEGGCKGETLRKLDTSKPEFSEADTSTLSELPKPSNPSKPKVDRARLVSLSEWREAIKAKGERSIPEDDPIFAYAATAKLLPEMLHVQWHHFVATYTQDRQTKRYVDWRAAFRNSVRQNWFRLWVIEAVGGVKWSSTGLQAQAVYRAEQDAADEGQAHA